MGIGEYVRQASLRTSAGTLAGSTTPGPRTAAEIAATNVGVGGLEFSRSEAAQQASASTWVKTRPETESCELRLCIGHSPSSAQHAMRSSGVAPQPAQIAAGPARKPRHNRTLDTRRRSATEARMLEAASDVKRAGAPEISNLAVSAFCPSRQHSPDMRNRIRWTAERPSAPVLSSSGRSRTSGSTTPPMSSADTPPVPQETGPT